MIARHLASYSGLFLFLSLVLVAQACYPKTTSQFFPDNGAKAIAILKGVSPNGTVITGTVTFDQATIDSPLVVSVNVTGLQKAANSTKHGFHVHQNGITVVSDDISAICGSTGSHFNPFNKTHGDINATTRHVGDYGNVIADSNGVIITTFTDMVSKLYGPVGIIGRTIVLHQLEDDLGLVNNTGSLTTGNAGGRVACGVIGVLNN